MKSMRSFASDNNAGIHPKILEAIADANVGYAMPYGDDPYSAATIRCFQKYFGENIDVYFTLTGTGANVISIASVIEQYQAVICAESAHINVDECGAPENFSGCKLLTIETDDGKINVEQIQDKIAGIGVEHHVQPRVISISQPTEMGTVYTSEEISEITDFAHRAGMLVHMDGARLANAVASLGCTLKSITAEAGIDVLSFGGTKNGMMIGEAAVFFDRDLSRHTKFLRKQGMQLFSKMRFVAVQFETYLTDKLYLENAGHANDMARLLAAEIEKIPGVKIVQPVESNGVFVIVPRAIIPALRERYFFHIWDEELSIIRLMTSFETQKQEVKDFAALLSSLAK